MSGSNSLPTHNPTMRMTYGCGHERRVDSRERMDGERARHADWLFLKRRGVKVGPWLCPLCRAERERGDSVPEAADATAD